MRLSKQHKQILLVLLRNNPRGLKLHEIVYPIRMLKWKKWEQSAGEDKLPQSRVLSASFCRSLKTLSARGFVTKEPNYFGLLRWSLTTEGLATAREIKREFERQIEDLRKQIEELDKILLL